MRHLIIAPVSLPRRGVVVRIARKRGLTGNPVNIIKWTHSEVPKRRVAMNKVCGDSTTAAMIQARSRSGVINDGGVM